MGCVRLELFLAIELVATVLMSGLCRAALGGCHEAMWVAS